MRLRLSLVAILALAGCARSETEVFVPDDPRPDPLPLDEIRLPPGFEITLFADRIPNARQLAIGPEGTVSSGRVGADAFTRCAMAESIRSRKD